MGNICNVEPLQAQGTVVVDSAQSISSENPLQNKVVTIEKANASALCVDLSGNPITFEADAQAVQKLQVALEPIQDLHGYDKPWVGDAGKNKLPMTVDGIKAINTLGTWSGNVYTLNNTTFEILVNSDNNVTGIKVNTGSGGASDASYLLLENSDSAFTTSMLGKSVILNGCPSGGSSSTYYQNIYYAGTSNATDTGSGASKTYPSTSSANNITINIKSGYACPTDGLIFYPMIRLSTESDSTFSPYTNICPISGRTETGVVSEGRNVYSGGNASGTLYVSKELSYPIPVGTYTLSAIVTSSDTDDNKCLVRDIGNDVALGTISRSTNNQRVSITFTTTKTIETIAFYASTNYAKSSGDTFSFTDIQIERGSTATAYEPYKTPVSCSIQFGQTVYGGTVDFKTGKVVVTKGTVELDGSNDENWSSDVVSGNNRFYCTNLPSLGYSATKTVSASSNLFNNTTSSSYTSMDNVFILRYVNTQNRIDIMCNAIADLTAFKALIASTPLTICYELGTPIELTLTPSELQLLKGYNYITADGVMDLSLVPDNVIEYIMGQIISAMGTDESGRTTASRAYTTGEYFYKDGKMYKALTSIASGATFTVGTNCSQTTIFAELKNAQN